MDRMGVQTSADKNTPHNDLGKWRSVCSAGIITAGVLDIYIQGAAQSRPLHGGLHACGYLHHSDSHPRHIYGRDGNPEPKRPQPQLGRRRCSGRVLLEAAPVTRIKLSLGLLRKALSLMIDGILFIVSMWFLIGLIGIALLVVIAFAFGVLSLF